MPHPITNRAATQITVALAILVLAVALGACAFGAGNGPKPPRTPSERAVQTGTATSQASASETPAPPTLSPDPNPLEQAIEELLPPDITVLERFDSRCAFGFGMPQPSCEFIKYVGPLPQEERITQATERLAAAGWTIVSETRYDLPGESGAVMFEATREGQFVRWRIRTYEQHYRGTGDVISLYYN